MEILDERYLELATLPASTGPVSAAHAFKFFDRMFGLLINRKEMEGLDALLISKCSAVHTFGMKYAIDVAFLDERMRVISKLRKLEPNRLAFAPKAYFALERKAAEGAWLEEGKLVIFERIVPL